MLQLMTGMAKISWLKRMSRKREREDLLHLFKPFLSPSVSLFVFVSVIKFSCGLNRKSKREGSGRMRRRTRTLGIHSPLIPSHFTSSILFSISPLSVSRDDTSSSSSSSSQRGIQVKRKEGQDSSRHSQGMREVFDWLMTIHCQKIGRRRPIPKILHTSLFWGIEQRSKKRDNITLSLSWKWETYIGFLCSAMIDTLCASFKSSKAWKRRNENAKLLRAAKTSFKDLLRTTKWRMLW